MSKVIEIGLVQHQIFDGNRKKTLTHLQQLLSTFDLTDCNLLVFPELFLSSYGYPVFGDFRFDQTSAPEIKFLSHLAQQQNLFVLFSAQALDEVKDRP